MANQQHHHHPQQQPNMYSSSSTGQNSQQFIHQQPSFPPPPPPQDGRFMHWGPPEYGMYPPPPRLPHMQQQGNPHHGPPPMHHGYHHPHGPPPPPHPHYHGVIAPPPVVPHHHHPHHPPPPGYQHHNGYAGLPPPPPHPSHPHLHHHHHTSGDQYLYHHHHHHRPVPSLDEEDDDINNMDPIELLHPDQNLLAPPPDTLPPLPESVSELGNGERVQSPNDTTTHGLQQQEREQEEEQSPRNVVTSPSTSHQQQTNNNATIEDITTVITKDEGQPLSQQQQQDQENPDDAISIEQQQESNNNNTFVEDFFGAPQDDENTDGGHHKFNLYQSKSMDSTDLCLQSLGKEEDGTNFETLDDDEASFLNNYTATQHPSSSIISCVPGYSAASSGEQQHELQQHNGSNQQDQQLLGENRYEMSKAGAFPMPSRPDENKPPAQLHAATPHFAHQQQHMVPMQPQRFAVMSPITMCFNRMLGAAEYIKTPGSANPKQRRQQPNASKVLPIIYEYAEQQQQQQPVEKKRPFTEQQPNPFDELADDPELERLVILQMAMQRQQHGNPYHPHGNAEKSVPITAPRSQVISEGFFWREYPACEQVLYTHMRRYYEISAIQRNYKVQQAFNNLLVEQVRKSAIENGFQIDPNFDDKKLRDRIRCFYKTHLQNAKKRLATLQKHSDLPDNRSLVAVFIRCVRNPGLTLEESLNMAEEDTYYTHDSKEQGPAKKQRRLDKVEKLKLSVKLHDGKQNKQEGSV